VLVKRHAGRETTTLRALLTGALFASALAACGPGEPEAGEAPPVAADTTPEIPAQATGPTHRAETLQDTLVLEGTPEPITLRLYRTPPGFPLPFSTYVPTDMAAEPVSSGEGDGVRFVAEFGGVRNDSAAVAVMVYPDGATEETARGALRAATGAQGPVARDEQRHPWALAEFEGGTGGSVARGMVGRHGGRFFHVLVRYPAEYGDGFAPRAAKLLDHWRWEDGSGGLGS
jgi:hypothetical protein